MTENTNLIHPLLRQRDGHHARVTWEELFFDLVYVFAVTQLSHILLHHLSASGGSIRSSSGLRSGWAGSTPAG